ncbi:MAG: radical SAM family heme chaperone HemW [Bacteroidales bacterium]|nr:radical SAM family heme chaperone HemW [Bacteroidales bacterium]
MQNSQENFGIYIHFPFCRRKCIYCDFYSVGERLADWEAFARAVENEFSALSLPSGVFPSLYMGGGTPSLAPAELISRFRRMIPVEVGEFTIEVNPDDVTEEKARAWREAGVNRVSMGIQTLNDDELKAIGRRHTADQAEKAYYILRKYFSNISLDLIFGLPGQTLSSLSATLDRFIEMRPEHISAYSLMYEERTALTRMRDSGKVEEIPDEDSVEMFRLVTSKLKEAGYERYEISNYALPGYRSHHNSNYWKGIPYIGLGPSAHSYDGDRTRRYNLPDLALYIKEYGDQIKEYGDHIKEYEFLSEEELREEMIMTRLRMIEGLDLLEFEDRFGKEERISLEKRAKPYLSSGDLIYMHDHIALSESGVMISDEIISELF